MSPSARHFNQESTSELLGVLSAEYFIAVALLPPPQPHVMSVEEAILASPSPSCIFLKWQRRAERAKTFETPTQGGSEYLLINNTHSTAARGLLPFWNPQLVEMAHMFAMKGNITSQVVTLQPYVGTGRVSRSFSSDYWVKADFCRSSGVNVLSIEEVTMDKIVLRWRSEEKRSVV